MSLTFSFKRIKGSTCELPHLNVEDVFPKTHGRHEIFRDIVYIILENEPLAKLYCFLDSACLVHEDIDGHLPARINNGGLLYRVEDQVFAVDYGFVDESGVLDSVDQQMEQRVMGLAVLESTIEPAYPLIVDLCRVKN